MDPIGLIPSFGGLIYTIGAFIIALSVIVAVHEYGHFIVGKWSGIQPEVFSIGFGPVLLSRTDKDGTRWQIAALPFGGYVKFLGDSGPASGQDSDALEDLSPEERRHTMHCAPLWARPATVAAGPAFNFALSFVVFAAVIMFRGIAADPITIETIRDIPAEVQELRPGDEILAIAGEEAPSVEEFDAFVQDLPVAPTLDYRVRRGDEVLTVEGPYPRPPLALSITPNSAAMDVGMEPGDVVLSVDGERIHAFSALREKVGDSGGKPLLLEVWRDGEVLEIALVPRRTDLPLPDGGFETRYLIGITGGLFFEPRTETPGLLEAAAYGVNQTIFIIQSSLSGLYHMAVGAISSCNLSGPIGIAETSGAAASQGWGSFIWFIAVLSTAVGLLNLFPIPVLDGGHLVFYAYEAVTGRPPSDMALRILMAIGLALLLTLMVFAVGNDLFCP